MGDLVEAVSTADSGLAGVRALDLLCFFDDDEDVEDVEDRGGDEEDEADSSLLFSFSSLMRNCVARFRT